MYGAWISRIVIGTGVLALTASAAMGGITPITSPDGTWRANVDAAGQVGDLFTPDQPTLDNLFESLVFVADSTNNQLSRRMENFWVVTSQSFTPNSSFTRLENTLSGLSIEIENIMKDGPNGGVLVKIRCENKGADPISCKIFYYVDYDISATFDDILCHAVVFLTVIPSARDHIHESVHRDQVVPFTVFIEPRFLSFQGAVPLTGLCERRDALVAYRALRRDRSRQW